MCVKNIEKKKCSFISLATTDGILSKWGHWAVQNEIFSYLKIDVVLCVFFLFLRRRRHTSRRPFLRNPRVRVRSGQAASHRLCARTHSGSAVAVRPPGAIGRPATNVRDGQWKTILYSDVWKKKKKIYCIIYLSAIVAPPSPYYYCTTIIPLSCSEAVGVQGELLFMRKSAAVHIGFRPAHSAGNAFLYRTYGRNTFEVFKGEGGGRETEEEMNMRKPMSIRHG